MIKARIGPLVLLGLDANNIRMLTSGNPVLVKGEDVGITGGLRVCIMYGNTIEDIVAEIEKSGIKVPRDANGKLVNYTGE